MINRSKFLLFSSLFFTIHSFGQDTTFRTQEIKEIQINENRIFKRIGLYDSYETDNTPSINGFTQLTIFDNTMSDEVWSSLDKKCVEFSLTEEPNNAYLNVKWNKDQEGCDWVGIGFGWDFWSSKDMGQIVNMSAIEIEIRSKGKDIGNLPWAFGFEDYAGGQAWTGFNKKFIPNGVITAEWTKVQIPVELFPFEDFDCDPSNIKQLIIQLFAQDEVEINAIRIVPFKGKLKEEVSAKKVSVNEIKLDGNLSDWSNMAFSDIDENNSFSVQHTGDSLYVAIKVKDSSPRINDHLKGELWNGDAIEIAFSTNSKANPKRNLFLLSDYHIGANCGVNPYLWSFSDDQLFDKGNLALQNSRDGYTVEIAIALKELMKREIT